jgi:hypothetical protein
VTITGTHANGRQIADIAMRSGEGMSLRDLAAQGEEFVHFGLTPERQYQSLADALERPAAPGREREDEDGSGGDRSRREPESPESEREELTRERLEQMSDEEKADEFWDQVVDEFWNDFSIPKLVAAVLFGIVVGIVGAIAIITTAPGWIAAFVVLAAIGVVVLLAMLISDLIRDIEAGDPTRAVIGVLKNLALLVAAVAGALAVVAMALGAPILGLGAAALTGIAIAALVVAVALMLARLWLNRERAVGTDDPSEFREAVDDAARQLDEIVTTIITIIVGWLAGKFGPRLPPGRGGGRGRPGPPEEGGETPTRPTPETEPAPTDAPEPHPSLRDHLDILRDLGIDIAVANRCIENGVTPESLLLRAIEGGPRLVAILDGLTSGRGGARIDPRTADRVAQLAHALDEIFPGRGLFDAVHDLATGGRLRNPQSLRGLMEDINTGDANKITELTIAAERSRAGHQVQLGPQNRVGADVVDITAEEAIQVKDVSSPDDRAVGENLTAAANQLAGRGARNRLNPGDPDTEVPPNRPDGRPYTRTAEIIIRNPRNPLHNADRAAVEAFVRDTLSTASNRAAVDQVRVTNGHPDSPFTITGPFN